MAQITVDKTEEVFKNIFNSLVKNKSSLKQSINFSLVGDLFSCLFFLKNELTKSILDITIGDFVSDEKSLSKITEKILLSFDVSTRHKLMDELDLSKSNAELTFLNVKQYTDVIFFNVSDTEKTVLTVLYCIKKNFLNNLKGPLEFDYNEWLEYAKKQPKNNNNVLITKLEPEHPIVLTSSPIKKTNNSYPHFDMTLNVTPIKKNSPSSLNSSLNRSITTISNSISQDYFEKIITTPKSFVLVDIIWKENALHDSSKGIRNAIYLFTLPIKENEKNIKVIEYRFIKFKSNTIETTLAKHVLNSIIKEFQDVKNLTIFVNSSKWCNIFKNSLQIDPNFENINKLFTIISVESSIKHKLLDLLLEKTIPDEAKKGKLFTETIEFNNF